MQKLFENWRKHISEAEYEPDRAVADIDTGEEHMSPEDLMRDEVQDLASRQEMSEGAELKIPVERYDAFKRKIEQWAMLFNKFTGQSQDLGHRDPEVVRAAAPKLLYKVNKLESELMKIMGEFDLNYKSYDDERHAMRQKLDRFDGDSEFFLEEEK